MLHKNEQGLFETDIDGKLYEFQKWHTEDSLNTLFDIAALLGSPLGSVASHLAKPGGMSAELPKDKADELISRLTGQLGTNRPMVMNVVKRLATHKVLCDGKAINFNVHYADDLGHLFMVARSNVEVQYENFFGALGALGQKGILAQSQATQPSTSGQASTA